MNTVDTQEQVELRREKLRADWPHNRPRTITVPAATCYPGVVTWEVIEAPDDERED